MEAILYIRTEPGRSMEVLERIRSMEGVEFAVFTTGRFDLVARVEGKDIRSLGEKVVGEIHELDGVTYTETAPVIG